MPKQPRTMQGSGQEGGDCNMSNEKIKVLVVDDQKSMKEFFIKFLTQQGGFNVEGAESGTEAMQLYESMGPDVVILDLGLPDMDGADVLRKMKEINSDIVVAILSGHEDRKDEMFALGAKEFFEKPAKPPELIEWINKMMS